MGRPITQNQPGTWDKVLKLFTGPSEAQPAPQPTVNPIEIDPDKAAAFSKGFKSVR